MNCKKLICSVLMLAALCAAPLAASAAPVTAVRSSVSPASTSGVRQHGAN